jgi:lipoyl(octanoyl) transferase
VPDVRDWGLRPYPAALEEMRALRADRRSGRIGDTLILVEHPPVITVGVQGSEGETFPPGMPVIAVERGGKSTYHGPGQLVGYPIVDLEPRGRDVRRFVGEVEGLVIDALAELGLAADRVPGRRGIWIAGERKIGSVGIAVEAWVSFHGFAVNVENDLGPFAAFRPCGFDGKIMTSVARELGRPVAVDALKGPVRRAWNLRFGPAPDPPGPLPATSAPAAP